MENRINKMFAERGKNILSVYFTAGYPKLDDTVEIIEQLSLQGANMIEIGVPFSDPMADGPVIQESGNIALGNGMSLKFLFAQLKKIRERVQVPLLIMSYLNPIVQFGFENFCKECAETGIDGMIIPDLPLSIYINEYKNIAEKYNLENILMITPETSCTRIHEIDSFSNGFIYMVSSASITGEQTTFEGAKEDYFRRIQEMNLKNPTLIGFGISNNETFLSACRFSSGAIVGSSFIKSLMKNRNIGDAVKEFLEKLKG